MRVLSLPADCDRLYVRPWADPVLDQMGYDPRESYVERFWLGLLGPSATWLVRYLATQFETDPHEFVLDFEACAAAIGLGRGGGRSGPLPKTLNRCCDFGVARMINGNTMEVRRKLAPLSDRQLGRLPDRLRAEHHDWLATAPRPGVNAHLLDQAKRLALSLFQLGEDSDAAERQLQRWRFPANLARDATTWAGDAWSGPSFAGGL